MNKWNYVYTFCKQMSHLPFLPFDLARLLFLFAGAILLTFLLADRAAIAGNLFQSPAASPVAPEVAPAQAVPVEPVPVQPAPIEPAPVQPTPVQEPVLAAPATTEAPAPVDPAANQTQPDPTAPEAAAPVSPLPEATEELAAPAPPPLPELDRAERIDRFDEEEGEDSANLTLDRAELVDTVVVSTAYVWLCCGIMLFLMIPLAFLFLQIRGRTKIKEEYL